MSIFTLYQKYLQFFFASLNSLKGASVDFWIQLKSIVYQSRRSFCVFKTSKIFKIYGLYRNARQLSKIFPSSAILLLVLFQSSTLFSQYDSENNEAEETLKFSIQMGDYTRYIQEIYGVYAFESVPPKILDDLHELDRIVYNILHGTDRQAEYAQKLEEIKRRDVHLVTTRLLKYIKDFESLEDVLQRSKVFHEAYVDARYPVDSSLISRLNTQLANIRLNNDMDGFHSRVRSFEQEIDRLLQKYRVSSTSSEAQRARNQINYDYVKNFRYQKVLPLVWVYEDISGRKMDNPMNLVQQKTPKELFAEFSQEKFPLLVDYFTSKKNFIVGVEHNSFELAIDNYAYYFVLHVKMFNRDFYFDISDYAEKMHSINMLELY
ncbi:MAG: hypothetical protein DBX03_03375 [Puniceicoccaceae bacterium]|nr:MAG: hypothetical protein DBX03_03375 [Puniceicoccaceae bacterium]